MLENNLETVLVSAEEEKSKLKPNYVDTLWCTYLVSVFAAGVAEVGTYPFDLLKTRLQIQGELANVQDATITRAPYRGTFRTAVGIIREEGLFHLWRGIQGAFLRHAVYSGTRMIIYTKMRDELFKVEKGGAFPLWQSAISGVIGGSVGQFLASPADLAKVHVQMEGKRRLLGEPPRVKGVLDALVKVYYSGGIKGLWKGAVPNTQRAALITVGDLSGYDVAKRFLLKNTDLKDGPTVHILGSFVAGFSAAVMGTPADVIKTRVMNQKTDETGRPLVYKNSWDCLVKSIQNEGALSLYKGFVPVWIRMAPWALLFWVSFEQTKSLLGAKLF